MQPAADTAGSVGAGKHPEERPQIATVPIRPLSFRELLDVPFALMQADIRILAGCAAVLLVAGELVVAGSIGLVSHLTGGSDTGTALAALFATLAAAWFVRFTLRGVTVAAGLARAARRPIGLRESLRRTVTRLGPLLITQLSFTAIGVAVLSISALLFPLTYLGGLLWFLVTYPCCLLWLAWLRARHLAAVPVLFAEGAGAGAALTRSGLLVGNMRMRRAGLRICQHLLFALLTAPLLGLVLFVADISGTHRWAFLVLVTTTGLLLAAFAEVVESSARVVGYLDLRCRREGADIRIPTASGGRR
ncbi:hypothetical protein [Nocardia jinanensis]|uniref:Uncharacterized protein n=1 Tax=Nocardia jinanensis TaxID=382504 RepID=A0A917RSU4_9NOCA|nr:hypothetical protein [Nocardia jinanensis]GGL25854.1 hypothetical protein GCM10011588_45820 [Nocardia jinanensis]